MGFVLLACATNPVTGRREFSLMSEAQEISIGRESDPQIRAEMGVYDDPELQQYVSELGMRLAKLSERPGLPWSFTVVDQPAINAFAVPGGFIYLTRGILAFLGDEAELVGVLGHEIGHVTARHSAQQYTRSLGGQLGLTALGIFVPAARPFGQLSEAALSVLFLSYGRDDELQSDQLGARYATAGGWNPAGVPGMLSTLGRLDEARGERKGVPNWLSTHPNPLDRVDEIRPLVQDLQAKAAGALETDREALLRRVDGIIFGDNPEQGVIRGRAFLHPPLRFRVDFPEGWQIANSPQQVVAQAPEGNGFLILQLVQRPVGRDIRTIALNDMQGAGFRAVQGGETSINGLDAFVGAYQGLIQGLGEVAIRAAHIAYDSRVYLLAGIVPPPQFQQADPTLTAAIRTFQPLTAAEAENIRPHRIDLYVVRQNDTWEGLAELSNGAIEAESLAIMNGAAPASAPPVGTRIKIVTGG